MTLGVEVAYRRPSFFNFALTKCHRLEAPGDHFTDHRSGQVDHPATPCFFLTNASTINAVKQRTQSNLWVVAGRPKCSQAVLIRSRTSSGLAG